MSATNEWPSPVAPQLADNEVHVWRASLEIGPQALQRLKGTLADDEKARAERFIFEQDRNRFIAARGILRDVLGKYLQCTPQAIDFVYGPRGKPAISSGGSRHPLCFNLSHSHGLAVMGIAREREIGIDIELIRPELANEEIAKRYFSLKEVDDLNRLSVERRAEGFFLCWTRKEAYIKARGDGLHIPLDSFCVSLSPDSPAELSSADESRWRIQSFVPSDLPEPRYAAAVVVEGKSWTAHYFDWKHVEKQATNEK